MAIVSRYWWMEKSPGCGNRSVAKVPIDVFSAVSSLKRDALEAEAMSLPLLNLGRAVTVRWSWSTLERPAILKEMCHEFQKPVSDNDA